MSSDPETTRIVRSWLDEGVTQLPDRVLDAVLDQLPATPQLRASWWPARKRWTVTTIIKFGLAAAVVAIVVLVGINSLGGTFNLGGPGVEPTPSSVGPSSTPERSSTPRVGLPEGAFVLYDGELSGGLRDVPITVTIPAPGWYGTPGDGILGNVPEAVDFAPEHAWLIGPFVGDIYVPADPCRWSTTMPTTPATTVNAVVAALQGQATRDASEPVNITVDGHAGKSITLHVPEDADFGECDLNTVSGDPEWCTLTDGDPTVCHRYHQFPGQIDELWVLDVNGHVTVIDATWSDATPAGALAELRAILESMTFD